MAGDGAPLAAAAEEAWDGGRPPRSGLSPGCWGL